MLRQPFGAQRVAHLTQARVQLRQAAEDALAREQHDDHQQQADPELPVHGIDPGEHVLRDHVDGGTDQRAVEPAGAAQHEHDHELRGAREAQRVESDELRALREQCAGDAGDRGAQREDGDEPPRDRRSDRRHSLAAVADAAQAQAERRVDDAAQEREQHEQHDEAVEVRGAAVDAEGKESGDLPHRDAGEPVDAAGDERGLVGGLVNHEADAERHHEPRQIGAAHDEEAHREAGERRGCRGGEKSAERLAPSVDGKQSGRIRADAEERGVTERYDAGVAEDQVERDGEESHDQDLAAEHEITRKREVRRDRQQPERDLERAPAIARQAVGGGACRSRVQ